MAQLIAFYDANSLYFSTLVVLRTEDCQSIPPYSAFPKSLCPSQLVWKLTDGANNAVNTLLEQRLHLHFVRPQPLRGGKRIRMKMLLHL